MRARLSPVALVWLATTLSAAAATFTVNDPGAGGDAVPGDGVCDAAPPSGVCTLAAAVGESNAHPGPDTIVIPAGTYAVGPIAFHDAVIVGGAGADATVIASNGSDTAVTVDPGVTVTLIGVTITGGHGTNVGGGVTSNGGTLTLIECDVRNNSAGNVGGGVYNNHGTLTMIGTSVHDNFAFNVGGGVHNEGTARLVNCTISGNRALNTAGGIGNEGDLTIESSTVTRNSVANTGAGLDNQFDHAQPVTLANTILSGNYEFSFNPVTGETTGESPDDCLGVVDSRGYNLIQASRCTIGNDATTLLGVDPQLDPLADNGGGTPTHALRPGSPAIDAANPAVPGTGSDACPTTDQRGIPRPQGARCDIGAYEASTCGNGVVDPGEACDDGNIVSGDGCDANCTPTGCGNGITTAGEECDDGNVADGDCCSSDCRLTVNDDVRPADPGQSKLTLVEQAKGLLSWSWKGQGLGKSDFGDPTLATSYTFCLVDESGASPSLVLSATAPAGGLCGGRRCWNESSSGFSYVAPVTGPGSVAKLKLKATARGATIALRGAGKRVRMGRLPLVTPVRAVLRRNEPAPSWGSAFGSASRNRTEQFKARSD